MTQIQIVNRRMLAVDTSDPDTCHVWPGGLTGPGYRTGNGYGCVTVGSGPDRKSFRVHRVVLEAKLGRPILDGLNSLHTCDNPPCCNPRHLYEGTQKQNMQDSVRRGRHGALRGEANPGCKLTAQQAQAIIDDPRSARVVAREFGISGSRVSDIRGGGSWPDLVRPAGGHPLARRNRVKKPPKVTAPRPRDLWERLAWRSEIVGDCLIWTGKLTLGCGVIKVDRKDRTVHRVAWELMNGPITEGMLVRQTCGNRTCWRIDHLVQQSVQEVRRESVAEGRWRSNGNDRRAHCAAGHPYPTDPPKDFKGARTCRECARLRQAEYRARKKEAA